VTSTKTGTRHERASGVGETQRQPPAAAHPELQYCPVETSKALRSKPKWDMSGMSAYKQTLARHDAVP